MWKNIDLLKFLGSCVLLDNRSLSIMASPKAVKHLNTSLIPLLILTAGMPSKIVHFHPYVHMMLSLKAHQGVFYVSYM